MNGVYGPFGGVWILREYQQIPGCNKNNCMNLTLALRDKLTVRWLEKKRHFGRFIYHERKMGGIFYGDLLGTTGGSCVMTGPQKKQTIPIKHQTHLRRSDWISRDYFF